MLKNEAKEELESLGERVGNRIGDCFSKGADTKASEIGKKAGKILAQKAERLHDALDKENVTKQEELGIGGKIGIGVGIIGKHLVERRHGLLGRLMGSANLVSQGRTTGAKAEKIVKRSVKTGLARIAGAKRRGKEDGEKGTEGP